jgi:tRNA (mo5U34)-methyltransferase
MSGLTKELATATPSDEAAVRSLAASVDFWWHSLDLGCGVVTKGIKSREYLAGELAALRLPDVRGKSVLDIGTWDGFYAFACERAGAARVVAVDHFVWSIEMSVFKRRYETNTEEVWPHPRSDPELWNPRELPGKRGFDVAHAALGSRVEPVVADFEHEPLNQLGRFDVVLYLGVVYHMPNPLGALRRLLAVTGDLAVIESDALAVGGFEDRPVLEFVGGGKRASDPTNWWIPNRLGLERLCLAAGFSRVEHVSPAPGEPPPGEIARVRTILHAWR